MEKWFLCKVRFDKTQDNGTVKKVTETYLLNAFTFTDAEARLVEEITPYISGEYEVTAIKKTNVSEIVFDDFHIASNAAAMVDKVLQHNKNVSEEPDKWFSCKLNFITLNEKTGKEKKSPFVLMVHANTCKAAHDLVCSHMKGSVADWSIEKIDETPILDVFAYKYTVKEADSE